MKECNVLTNRHTNHTSHQVGKIKQFLDFDELDLQNDTSTTFDIFWLKKGLV